MRQVFLCSRGHFENTRGDCRRHIRRSRGARPITSAENVLPVTGGPIQEHANARARQRSAEKKKTPAISNSALVPSRGQRPRRVATLIRAAARGAPTWRVARNQIHRRAGGKRSWIGCARSRPGPRSMAHPFAAAGARRSLARSAAPKQDRSRSEPERVLLSRPARLGQNLEPHALALDAAGVKRGHHDGKQRGRVSAAPAARAHERRAGKRIPPGHRAGPGPISRRCS